MLQLLPQSGVDGRQSLRQSPVRRMWQFDTGKKVAREPREFFGGACVGRSTSEPLGSPCRILPMPRAMPLQRAFGVLLLARRFCGGAAWMDTHGMASRWSIRKCRSRDVASDVPLPRHNAGAGFESCRHHKAVAAPGRATTNETCPAWGRRKKDAAARVMAPGSHAPAGGKPKAIYRHPRKGGHPAGSRSGTRLASSARGVTQRHTTTRPARPGGSQVAGGRGVGPPETASTPVRSVW
jgi:hypothetical protein